MNIFVTSKCPIKSAQFMDDKRVVKMCLESAQMLCTSINEKGGISPYKTTHKNHPSSVWARHSKQNYLWLCDHFKALCNEYTNRYNKTHKCQQYYDLFIENSHLFDDIGLTPFANCAANKEHGLDYKHVTDVYNAYMLYLNDRWQTDKRTPTWYKVAK